MEQLQEEVPEVREEEEEEEEAVTVPSGASDPSAGPDSSLPSSSYTGEWSHIPHTHREGSAPEQSWASSGLMQ